jgi:diguanylate cyclase (GGDEF)-like protein
VADGNSTRLDRTPVGSRRESDGAADRHEDASASSRTSFASIDRAHSDARDLATYRNQATTWYLRGLAGLSALATVAALATSNGLIDLPYLSPTVLDASLRVAAMNAVAFAGLAELHRRGHAWAANVASVLGAFVIIPQLPTGLFEQSVPQAVWLPVMFAYALTTLRWTSIVGVLTIVLVYAFHGEANALWSVPAVVVTLMMFGILAGSRALQDRLLEATRAHVDTVERLAFYDELTGLPNRHLLRDRINESIKRTRRRGATMATMIVDLDRFQEVGDSLGQAGTGEVLAEVGRRLRASVREADTVAHLEGDRFAVVVPELPDREAAERIAHTIVDAIARPMRSGDDTVHVTASVGLTFFPDDGETPETLLLHAGGALSLAKVAGRGAVRSYEAGRQDTLRRRHQLTNDLRGALDAQQLSVVYQPIVDLASGEIRKAEALLRWKHPSCGFVSPAEFIPIAESTGLIEPIGDWVFAQATSQVERWRREHHPEFQISVNRSPVEFRSAAKSRASWHDQVAQAGLPGESIVLEITEGALLDSGDDVAEQLRALRAAGIGLSLDDFGTGYSSLSYLRAHEMDFVKIDRSFVREMTPGSKNFLLCRSIVSMAHALGMKVVAEGVETETERALLVEAGCDFAQGYLFGRPVPPNELEQLLAQGRPSATSRSSLA